MQHRRYPDRESKPSTQHSHRTHDRQINGAYCDMRLRAMLSGFTKLPPLAHATSAHFGGSVPYSTATYVRLLITSYLVQVVQARL